MKKISKEQWSAIYDFITSVEEAVDALKEKGLEAFFEFSTGIYPCNMSFVVNRRGQRVYSYATLNLIEDMDIARSSIIDKSQELVSIDYIQQEKDKLLARIAEIEELQKVSENSEKDE